MPNYKTSNGHSYDLEERCFVFSKDVRCYVKNLPKITQNFEDGKQLIRSSGSMGANYIEANEALSKKDFLMRLKISKKESKETIYWLRLTQPDEENEKEKEHLIDEATQIMKIFGSIIEKSK